jgi:peptide/nickel transport system substrate-binding protein
MQRDMTSGPGRTGLVPTRRELLALAALGMAGVRPAMAGPSGQLTYAVHISLAPTWFDPAETPSLVTPYMLYYALHDAMLKPMPGELAAHSLAESWSATEDGMSYSFVLRDGVTFHNGEKVTAEDVKFSFERYHGAAKGPLHDRVASVETPDARHITFRLKNPWPDFLTFYAATTGAGWIVPKKYLEKVGDDGFKKAPIGAGPYKFVSFTPGVELVLEAYEGYWSKVPSVKRLVLKVIPEEATRLSCGRHRG